MPYFSVNHKSSLQHVYSVGVWISAMHGICLGHSSPPKSVHYNTRGTRMYVMLPWLQFTYPWIRIIVSFAPSGEITHVFWCPLNSYYRIICTFWWDHSQVFCCPLNSYYYILCTFWEDHSQVLRHDHMINWAICIFHFDASERAEERF